MVKILFGVFIALLVGTLAIIIIPLTALGLVPGLSPLFGASAKDFGIKVTKEDSFAAHAKAGIEIVSLAKNTDPNKDFTLEGRKDTSFTLDSKELTAFTNNRPWIKYPIKNVQVRIDKDGTIESSATLIVSRVMPFAVALGYSESQIKDAMKKFSIPPFEVPVYVKGKGSVLNDVVSINAQIIKIGAIPVPGDIVKQINKGAEPVLDDIIQKHSASFHAETLNFADGRMIFKGTVPRKQYVMTE